MEPAATSMPPARAEEFRPTWGQTWRGHLLPMLPVQILTALLLWVIGYVAAGPVGSVAAPVLVVGGLVALARWIDRSELVRMSADGVELVLRGGVVRRMRWADVERVAPIPVPARGAPFARGLSRAVAEASLQARAASRSGPGLVGWGQQLAADGSPVDPGRVAGVPRDEHGRLRVVIPLTVVDRAWQRGRMGEWVRERRPDLLPAG
jgi:hypothetical protein